jgi:hypothetical protein
MKTTVAATILGIAAIVCMVILGKSYTYKYTSTETISVTGLAEKNFTSDQIVWSGSYSRKMSDLKSAYQLLKQDEMEIRNYLKQQGVSEQEAIFSAVNIEREFDTKFDSEGKQAGIVFSGYNLRQSVTVDSKEIQKIEQLSRKATELIERGIEFNSAAPSYYYSKLSELKIDLLAKASADARSRAETIARNSGSSLGKTRKASMGVFQITGQNSNEDYSYGGVFNTSSKHKTASITVRVEYAVK